MTENKIKVSIVCNAYNHEKFIAKALEGMLMQETSFPFEILVHDDASTDKTADIIKEYEKKYPELIKPIYETENLYSKGNGLLQKLQYGRAKGKYIAICEGDDYWVDPLKLQKQYDALEKHPEIDICATAALKEQNGKITGETSPSKSDTIFSVEEVILGGGSFVETATLMMKKHIVNEPRKFLEFLRLDFSIQISGAINSGMLYIADRTAVYRLNSSNTSWSVEMEKNVEKSRMHTERISKMLDILNEETNFQYDKTIQKKKRLNEFYGNVFSGNYLKATSREYKDIFKEQSSFTKLKIILKALKQKMI